MTALDWLDAANMAPSTRERFHVGWTGPRFIVSSARETGDLVLAVVPHGSNRGTHVGRVAVRASGKFNVTTKQGTVHGVAARHFRVVQHADGYRYEKGEAAHPPLGLCQDVSASHKR
jgi:hypothetical protein